MDLLPVTELRQWSYCPRVVYYHSFMAGAGRETYKMTEGHRAQEMIERLEMRRTLREYGLGEAERVFGVALADEGLGLSGKLDLLLRSVETAAVVDFKLTSSDVGENHRIQLGGYAALVEAQMGLRVEMTFVFRIPDGAVFPVPVTEDLRARVRSGIGGVREMRRSGMLPGRTAVAARCAECEYANFCGDVW